MELSSSIEHLFRHEYGKIVAALISKYSSSKIDLIEDSVQEALLKAMKMWAFHKAPENPSAWLYKVANNYLIDQLRRGKKSIDYDFPEDAFITESDISDSSITSDIQDEQLKMIFACCHPILNNTEQIMLSLKLMCGLSIREIASALMKKEEAVKKAITRAKAKFKNEIGEIEVPSSRELKARLDAVLKVIYLMFNEGYKATEGDKLVKKDICLEAIRLAKILLNNKSCNTPELNAILALMYFNSARFDARINENGELVTLENQDRKFWDKDLIRIGFYYLARSSNGINITEYHLEAGIASQYVTAESFNKTNWKSILDIYDILIKMNKSPIVALNRLVVLEKVQGTTTALSELNELENEKSLLTNHLYYSIKADFNKSAGNYNEAKSLLKKAISLSTNSIEKSFLNKKLAEIS